MESKPMDDLSGEHVYLSGGGRIDPMGVDHLLRQAIQLCWLLLPQDHKTADKVEEHMRHRFDRVIRDLREDEKLFGGQASLNNQLKMQGNDE